ncbi:hypothetical protein DL766_004251 [Monosporascus sp. MC13-8B]|uniref:Cyanovirin-N domain-containing protein n=1 Tax=Monosporascus cannonballus TaxID=155416 RepID=A0ABY0HE47_9PEZI|nr:hypothetical protein DL762_002673 [Monosporascus cannonballus]RYO95436.1 hypothetical protein DL763_003700 [Monosporascus cannonballus]RYP31772.1 hypothetical protein DL766_004251 [Monosporascus sp. MC13-8B]
MTLIEKITSSLLLAVVLPSALAMPAQVDDSNDTAVAVAPAMACDCRHNNDAGRWRDPEMGPSGRLAWLCSQGGGCHTAQRGRMCVSGDLNQCGCATQSARDWESWHGDWFLWSSVTCGRLSVTITSPP